MGHLPDGQRTARFVCVMACVLSPERAVTAEGECHGIITRFPRGEGGFGYDPVFFLPSYNRTMAELSSDEKNKISHRAQASACLYSILFGNNLELR